MPGSAVNILTGYKYGAGDEAKSGSDSIVFATLATATDLPVIGDFVGFNSSGEVIITADDATVTPVGVLVAGYSDSGEESAATDNYIPAAGDKVAVRVLGTVVVNADDTSANALVAGDLGLAGTARIISGKISSAATGGVVFDRLVIAGNSSGTTVALSGQSDPGPAEGTAIVNLSVRSLSTT